MTGRLPPSTLLLDLGGVLVEFDFARVGTRISRITGLEFEAVREAFRAGGLAARYESGLLSDADFHAQICRRLGREIVWSDFADAWNSIFLRLPLVPEEVVAELASRARLWLVSNTNRLHFDFVRERFPLLRHFSGYVLSHEVGAMKPDPRIFAAALERAAAPASDTLFVDDLEVNVEAARGLGIDAFRFRDTEQFVAELRARNLL